MNRYTSPQEYELESVCVRVCLQIKGAHTLTYDNDVMGTVIATAKQILYNVRAGISTYICIDT